ncbi:MAG: hypothetical protein OEY67_08240 [Gammaproteobacteria bacterium]|nr:hypothetical protein [Gammaproteobacteria bacterium]
MQVYKPTTADEYLDLVDQAIFEMDDVLACADQEGEDIDLSELVPLYQYLVKELRKLHENLTTGQHSFGQGETLPFAELVAKWSMRIPCVDLLNHIIRIYREGFK